MTLLFAIQQHARPDGKIYELNPAIMQALHRLCVALGVSFTVQLSKSGRARSVSVDSCDGTNKSAPMSRLVGPWAVDRSLKISRRSASRLGKGRASPSGSSHAKASGSKAKAKRNNRKQVAP